VIGFGVQVASYVGIGRLVAEDLLDTEALGALGEVAAFFAEGYICLGVNGRVERLGQVAAQGRGFSMIDVASFFHGGSHCPFSKLFRFYWSK
jgi:hypothetical protein